MRPKGAPNHTSVPAVSYSAARPSVIAHVRTVKSTGKCETIQRTSTTESKMVPPTIQWVRATSATAAGILDFGLSILDSSKPI